MMDGIENNMTGEMGLQCKFVLVSIGELGLRAGEVAHMTRDDDNHNWVDLANCRITIPEWSPCNCGDCRSGARQEANQKENVSFEESMAERWKPVSESAQRTVHFHYNTDIVELYKRFFELYDEWPVSRTTINRRVKRIVRNSKLNRAPNSINPQTLRACAAYYQADQGMNASALADMMGWKQDETSLKFIKSADDGVRSELSRIHGD
jgi:integrase